MSSHCSQTEEQWRTYVRVDVAVIKGLLLTSLRLRRRVFSRIFCFLAYDIEVAVVGSWIMFVVDDPDDVSTVELSCFDFAWNITLSWTAPEELSLESRASFSSLWFVWPLLLSSLFAAFLVINVSSEFIESVSLAAKQNTVSDFTYFFVSIFVTNKQKHVSTSYKV